MTGLKPLTEKLFRERVELSIGSVAIFAILFTIKDGATYPWFKAIVSGALVWILLKQKKPFLSISFWVILLAYHIPILSKNMYYAANHYFVLVYLMIAILIFRYLPSTEDRFRFHLKIILAFIMFFGGLHKLLEPTYVNGSFFMYQINMGIFLKPFAGLLPEWKDATLENLKMHKELQNISPSILKEYQLEYPVKSLRSISLFFAWGAIFMEIGTGLLVALFPKKIFTHIFLFLTIISVFVFRLETGFLSLIAAIGMALSPSKKFTIFYLALFIIFIALLISGLGLK